MDLKHRDSLHLCRQLQQQPPARGSFSFTLPKEVRLTRDKSSGPTGFAQTDASRSTRVPQRCGQGPYVFRNSGECHRTSANLNLNTLRASGSNANFGQHFDAVRLFQATYCLAVNLKPYDLNEETPDTWPRGLDTRNSVIPRLVFQRNGNVSY